MKRKLYGTGNLTGNSKSFNHYTFEKTKEMHKTLSPLFKRIFGIEWPMIVEREGDNDEPIVEHINIEKFKDFHQLLGGIKNISENRIDVFYGDKKIFVTIHCSQKLRLKFNEELDKISEMPEPAKEKKLK